MFIIVGILVAIVIGLLIYNVQIHRKIQEFNSLQRQANNLRVLQDFLSTIGETSSVDDKIKKINDILIENNIEFGGSDDCESPIFLMESKSGELFLTRLNEDKFVSGISL